MAQKMTVPDHVPTRMRSLLGEYTVSPRGTVANSNVFSWWFARPLSETGRAILQPGGKHPAQDVRQQRADMGVGMRAVAPFVPDVVARPRVLSGIRRAVGELECLEHLLVRQEPVAPVVVQIVRSVLQEDTERLDRQPANPRRVDL